MIDIEPKEIKLTLELDGETYTSVFPEADENDPYKLTHYCGIANITSKFLDLVLEKREAKL